MTANLPAFGTIFKGEEALPTTNGTATGEINQTTTPLKIGIVVGEASGDILGAGLVAAIQKKYPDAIFEGIGGDRMIALGFRSLYAMDRLSVMGLVEPLKRLFELLSIRKNLYSHFLETRPDVVIGIDSPDFNLGLELKLREQGIKTAHYVSPSVWAWRQGRVKKIAKAVDLMLTLFTFEEAFYKEHTVPVACVGHPLADEIAFEDGKEEARAKLGQQFPELVQQETIIAVMPGSRSGEVKQLFPYFLDSIVALHKKHSDWQFIIPAANTDRKKQIETHISERALSGLPITVLLGQSQTVMAASNLVLMASGTTTLEATLLKRPMIVGYRFPPISYWVLSRLVKSKYFSLPNLLADKSLVPELRQNEVCADVIVPLAEKLILDSSSRQSLISEFERIHKDLARDASKAAAHHIIELINRHDRLEKSATGIA